MTFSGAKYFTRHSEIRVLCFHCMHNSRDSLEFQLRITWKADNVSTLVYAWKCNFKNYILKFSDRIEQLRINITILKQCQTMVAKYLVFRTSLKKRGLSYETVSYRNSILVIEVKLDSTKNRNEKRKHQTRSLAQKVFVKHFDLSNCYTLIQIHVYSWQSTDWQLCYLCVHIKLQCVFWLNATRQTTMG